MNEKQKVTIIINGKEYEVEMWHNEVEKVVAAAKREPLTGYERVDNGSYYCVDKYGNIDEWYNDSGAADRHYGIANYYSNRTVAANNQRADMLMRKIRRFAAVNGGMVAPWELLLDKAKQNYYYHISCDVEKNLVCCQTRWDVRFGLILFHSKEGCQKCIEVFHDELLWYFTEYEPQLYEED